LIITPFLKALALQTRSRRHNRCALLPQLIFAMLCIQFLVAQETKLATNTTGRIAKPLEAPMQVTGVHYNSGNRQDPFLNPLLLKKEQKPLDEELSRGLPPPGIAGTYIAQAVLQGTSVREDRRIAVVRGADTRAYFLKEGDRLFDGYVKTIELDSITLVRETKMRSGKTLTQDVIKRLRTP
jgi:hypothetical protein